MVRIEGYYKIVFFFLVLTLINILVCRVSFSQDVDQGDNEKVPAGMEYFEVGSAKIVVPKGIEIQKKGGLIILEDVQKYVARKLYQMEERLKRIEQRQKELEVQIEHLKERDGK